MTPPDPAAHGFLGGRLRLLQPARGHRAGSDAILLAAAFPPPARGVIVDLGAGVGAAGLAAALAAPGCDVVLVDREAASLDLAVRNIALNGLAGRVSIVKADILAAARARRAAGLRQGMAVVVLANPPFGEAARMRASPDPARADAHVMAPGGLARWAACAADLLATKGVFVMIHRADMLAELLNVLGRAFGGLAARSVHPRAGAPATRILVRGIKGSRAPLSLLPGLVLHEGDGRFTAEAEAIHRGAARIAF